MRTYKGPRSSLNHLVRAYENPLRNLDAEGVCRLKIYYELILGRLFHRKVSGFRSFKDFVHEPRSIPIESKVDRTIGHQTTRVDKILQFINGWQFRFYCKFDNFLPVHIEHRLWRNVERLDAAINVCKRVLQLIRIGNEYRNDVNSQAMRCVPCFIPGWTPNRIYCAS